MRIFDNKVVSLLIPLINNARTRAQLILCVVSFCTLVVERRP